MYDFHKNRNTANENLFYHKLFIRGQKNLLKLIKRKTNTTNEVTHPVDQRTTKKDSDNVNNLMKKVEEISKSYEECEKKIQCLTVKNEEITSQNQSILQEIYNKNAYSKKLESLLSFIIEMFLPKNVFNGLLNSEDAKKMLKAEPDQESTGGLSGINGDKYRTDEQNNVFKNSFNETFFSTIYEKLRESIVQGRLLPKEHLPMLLADDTKSPATENIDKTPKEEFKSEKTINSSPNPFVLDEKPMNQFNREDRFTLYKVPSSENVSFLGRKTAKNKENNCANNNKDKDEVFRISKQNSGITNNFNISNEEDDIRKYLECNEKNEEANKMSFDNNFLTDENLFDFNGNNNVNNVNTTNINNNINHNSQEANFI